MLLARRRPDAGYLDTHLWLPKTHVVEMQLRGSLLYDRGEFKEPIQAWKEERYHFVVPRNFMLPGALSQLPFPVYDTRIRSYPRVDIKSKITLDFLYPDKHVQRTAQRHLLNTFDGILCLRCGAGKTVTALDTVTKTHVPALIIVDTIDLAEQWKEEILEWTDLEEDDIGMVGDGEFVWRKPICIAMIHTLATRAQKGQLPVEMLSFFGVIVPDECHTLGAPWFNSSVPPFHGRRWGLSATPNRNDDYATLLRYTMGEVIYTYLEPELIPDVVFRDLSTFMDYGDKETVKAITDVSGEVHLQKLYGYLATREDRTKKMLGEINQAVKDGRQVLVLSQSRAMVETLGAKIPGSGICHGGVKDRKERRRRIRECNPVVAIAKLGKQALNKPQLDTLFVVEPFSDINVLMQIMGRILRLYSAKKRPLVVFYDEGNADAIERMCKKVRKLLRSWPKHMGGQIKYLDVKDTASGSKKKAKASPGGVAKLPKVQPFRRAT